MLFNPSVNHNGRGATAARLAAEVADLLGDELAHRPAVLCRPGPQPCSQIAPTHAEALARLNVRRTAREWQRLQILLRVGRAVWRLIRRLVNAEVGPIVAEVLALRKQLDAKRRPRDGQ
jgi:hypothetical protein